MHRLRGIDPHIVVKHEGTLAHVIPAHRAGSDVSARLLRVLDDDASDRSICHAKVGGRLALPSHLRQHTCIGSECQHLGTIECCPCKSNKLIDGTQLTLRFPLCSP